VTVAKPVVFISSTCEDLKKTGHREAARDAAIGAGFYPEMQEYWAAKDNPPLDECLARVEHADVLVVVVAHRFGWVPKDQREKDPARRKSITWLECEKAKEVLAFIIDKEHPWPAELREEQELVLAVQENKLTPELSADIQWRVNRLKDFKAWLSDRGVRPTFMSREDLRGKIETALLQWRIEHGLVEGPPRRYAPDKYLRTLREETSHIEIRGLQVQSGKAQRFSIDQLYIPLKTTLAAEPSRRGRAVKKDAGPESQARAPIELHEALKERRLVILGDPGTGKTTFLNRIAYALCNSRLSIDAPTTARTLGLDERALPVLIQVAELAKHIATSAPGGRAEPNILAHFVAATNTEGDGSLDAGFFQRALEKGLAVILLDGLDETATAQQRTSVAELVTRAAGQFGDCRFVVTTRPPAYEGGAVLPDFVPVWIDPLDDPAIEGFLTQWCRALFVESERQAQRHYDALLQAVHAPEIRRLARNPVMLTALAVVHWHEKRLPEQRAYLYDSIITWLSRSREKRPERLVPDAAVARLWELALAMQNHAKGRQVQVPRRWAAEQIAAEFGEVPQERRLAVAEQFLREEELDSGIVVRRGEDIRFWHLTFQEFLAAQAIASRPEEDQKAILLRPSNRPRAYLPAWREVVLLLAGVLHKDGRHRKVDGFVSGILEPVCGRGSLADEARCAGLLGSAVRDLSAVGYRPADPRYEQLMGRVMGIFDAEHSKAVGIKVAIEAAEALGQAGDPRFIDPTLEENWVSIPAGEFRMGAQKDDPSKPNYDSEAYEDERPVHRVGLKAYRIGRYPVTVGEYLRFIEAGGYEDKTFWSSGGFGQWQAPDEWEEQLEHGNRPVVGVSWFEAAAYATWAGSRLPTEAEWERAARGPKGRRYPWGDEEPDTSRMNYDKSKVGHPTPVGVYARGATPDGILDMAGNVWEWCSDWHDEDYYSEAASDSPQGPSTGEFRVARGGCWYVIARICRSACRSRNTPGHRYGGVGFRVVLDLG
jgi:formylglycine-generating enzyme required for sulfatase activity